jgi:lysophospholipase L1-like esterase
VVSSFVAVGDSFSEGLDDRLPDGTFRGWADLVAAELSATTPGFRYANLAVRGKRLEQIVEHQVPRVEAMRPDLVSIAAGGNDIIGLRCDVPGLGRAFDEVLARLAATGAHLLVFTGFDPGRALPPLGRLVAHRTADYNVSIVASAARLGATLVDLWDLPGLYRPELWAPDRLHMSAQGHALVADAVLAALGLDRAASTPEQEQAAARRERARWAAARRDDAAWARQHFAPWVVRKLRGRSTGDLVDPKLPELTELGV